MALEDSSHVEVGLEQITTYEQLEAELSYYEAKLKRATSTERVEIQKWINDLQQLRSEWDSALAEMKAPENISKLDTLAGLESAITYYSTKQKNASASEIVEIQRTIEALEAKRDSLKRLTELPSMEKEITGLDQLTGKGLQMKLELIGLDTIKSRIKSLQSMLEDTENPLGEGMRSEVEGMIKKWERYGEVLETSGGKGTLVAGAMGQLSGMMKSLSGAVGEAAGGWLTYGANVLSAVAEAMPALAQVIGGNIAQAFSGAAAQSQTVPFPFNLVALAASMAAVGAAVASIPKYAEGGLAYGPTLGIFGEYSGASHNPEVVAPLDRLRELIGPTGGDRMGEVEFRIEGRDLVGIIAKEGRNRRRTR